MLNITPFDQYLVFVQGEIVRLRKLVDRAPDENIRDGIRRALLELLGVENYLLHIVLISKSIDEEMHVQEVDDA